MSESQNDDARLQALLRESERNNRDNPAVAEGVRFKPAQWTPEQERELVERIHGDEATRLDAMIAELNARNRQR